MRHLYPSHLGEGMFEGVANIITEIYGECLQGAGLWNSLILGLEGCLIAHQGQTRLFSHALGQRSLQKNSGDDGAVNGQASTT